MALLALAWPAVTPRLSAFKLPLAVDKMLSYSALIADAVRVSPVDQVVNLEIVPMLSPRLFFFGLSCFL